MSLYLPMTSRFLMTRFLAASFAMWRTQPSGSEPCRNVRGKCSGQLGEGELQLQSKLVEPAERRFFSFQTSAL